MSGARNEKAHQQAASAKIKRICGKISNMSDVSAAMAQAASAKASAQNNNQYEQTAYMA